MLLTPEDTAQAAERASAGLTELERIAVGTVMITGATRPDSWLTVRNAGCVIQAHAKTLLGESLQQPDRPVPTIPATTLRPQGDRCPRADMRVGTSGSRATSSRRAAWARAWDRVMAWDEAFSDSWAGVALGGVCMAIFALGCVLAAGVLQ